MSNRGGSNRGKKTSYQQNNRNQSQKPKSTSASPSPSSTPQRHHGYDSQAPSSSSSASPLSHTPAAVSRSASSPSSPRSAVQVNNLVAAQIIKHARDNLPSLVTGLLLGLDVDDHLEITYSFPMLKQSASSTLAALPDDAKDDAAAPLNAVTSHQVQMLKCLRQVNVDNNIVGWYQTVFLGNLINDALIETQFQYQSSLPHAVCLAYDPLKSTQGALSLKAYRLSDAFMAFFSQSAFTSEKLSLFQVSHAAVLEEVPVEIHNSILLEGLLAEFSCADLVPSHPRLDLPHASFVEKTLEQMIDYSDELVQDMTHHQYWQRKRNIQLQHQAKRAHIRREINADRVARGLPPLPEEPDTTKPLSEPSRLESLLLSAQLDQYAAHLNTFAGQAFGKLFLLEGLQAESSTIPYPNSSYAAHAQKATLH